MSKRWSAPLAPVADLRLERLVGFRTEWLVVLGWSTHKVMATVWELQGEDMRLPGWGSRDNAHVGQTVFSRNGQDEGRPGLRKFWQKRD